ncbi:MAG: peptidoglycan DD-metalloendopeptidase family protein [Candidatus Nanopelagicales bacterium]
MGSRFDSPIGRASRIALAAGLSVTLFGTLGVVGADTALAKPKPHTGTGVPTKDDRVIPLPAGTWGWATPFGAAGPMWASGHHTGQDFRVAAGTPILAAAAGTVIFTGNGGPYGNLTEIQHSDGVQTWYAHQSRISTTVGSHVRAGQVIGVVGATGNTTGPHLHFEVRVGGQTIDPRPWLSGAAAVAAQGTVSFDPAVADQLRAQLAEAEVARNQAARVAAAARAKAAKVGKQAASQQREVEAARKALGDYAREVYKAGIDPQFLLQADALSSGDLANFTDRQLLIQYSNQSQNQTVNRAVKALGKAEAFRQEIAGLNKKAQDALDAADMKLLDIQTRLDASEGLWMVGTTFDGKIPAGGSKQAQAAVKFALAQIGHPYTHDVGTGPADACNGLIWRAWHEAGSKWPIQMANQQALNRRWVVPVKSGDEQPGDMIFFRFDNGTDLPGRIDHVGMVVNPSTGAFVHASSPRTGVELNNYKTTSYYGHPAMFGRMIVSSAKARSAKR